MKKSFITTGPGFDERWKIVKILKQCSSFITHLVVTELDITVMLWLPNFLTWKEIILRLGKGILAKICCKMFSFSL